MSLTLRLSVLCSTHTHTSAHFLYLSLHLSSSFSSLERGNREGRNDRVRGFTEDWLFIIVFGPLNSDSNRMRWGEKPVPLITVSGGPEPSGDASISHVPGRGTQSDFQASRPRSTAVQPPTWGCWRMKSAGGGWGGKGVGGFSHSIFLKCSDTLHLQLSPVSSKPKQGSALFKNPKCLLPVVGASPKGKKLVL